MTKQLRKAPVPCLRLPFSLMNAGERIGFISLA